MNKIQYIGRTHTSKDMAKEHKQKANTFHDVYFKNASFDDVCDILDGGSTFGRIGKKTDFVAIDIDDTNVSIDVVYEKYKDNPNYHVSYSSSMNPKKYHILVKLDKEITVDEYKDTVNAEFQKIKKECCGRCDWMNLDTHADNFYQCFFGASVNDETAFILDNSRRLYKWTKKDDEPMEYIENHVSKFHPSLNSADFCHKHNLLALDEEKRFDLFVPSMTKGRLKRISEGHRYSWAKLTGAKLLMRVYYLNEKFNESWTKQDYLDTFEWLVRTNVIKPDEFCKSDDYKGLERFFDNKWDILLDKTYEQKCEILEPYFEPKNGRKRVTRKYKRRDYFPITATQIAMANSIDGKNLLLFEDKDELKLLCQTNDIDFYRTMKFFKDSGYVVEFVCEKKRKTCLDDYEVKDGTVCIPKSKITSTIKAYCSRHNIKIQLH